MADQPTLGWYRVCLNTIVRKDVKLDSERLRILPMGSRVNVVKKEGRRVMIDQPIKGWCSLSSSNGDTILKPLLDTQSQQTPRATDTQTYQSQYSQVENELKQKEKELKELADKNNEDAEKKQMEIKTLKEERNYLSERLEQNKETIAELESKLQAAGGKGDISQAQLSTDLADMVFRNGDCILVGDIGVGMVRYYGKSGDQEIIGIEVSDPMYGDCNGYHKETDKQLFTVQEKHGKFIERKLIQKYLMPSELMIQLEKTIQEKIQLQSVIDEMMENKKAKLDLHGS